MQLPDSPARRQARLPQAQTPSSEPGSPGQGPQHHSSSSSSEPGSPSTGSTNQQRGTSTRDSACSLPGHRQPRKGRRSRRAEPQIHRLHLPRTFAQCHSCLTGLTDKSPVGQQQVDRAAPLGLLAGEGASTVSSAPQLLQENRREKTCGERKSLTLRDQGSAAAELAHTDSSSPHHHVRAASPSTGKSASVGTGGRKGSTAQRGERLDTGTGSSTHLFELGSWWAEGEGMSDVLQCPLQG